MKAAAAIEWNGIPIDTVTLGLLRRHWTGIQDELIAEMIMPMASSTAAASGRNAGNNGLSRTAFRGRQPRPGNSL